MSANVRSTAQTERNRPWLCFGIAFALIFFVFFLILSLTTPLLDPLRRQLVSPAEFSVAEGAFAALDDRLVCAGEHALYVYTADGAATEYPAEFAAPRFRTCGERLLVFDATGQSAALLSGGQTPVFFAADGALFDASVAGDGSFAMLFDVADSRAVLEVYDADGALRFRHRSKTTFLNTCALSPDASLVAVTALGQEKLDFQSALCLYRTDTENAPTTWPLDGVPLACGFLSNEALYVYTDTGLYLYYTDGTLLHALPGGRLLAQDGDGLLAAADGTVQVFSADGTQTAFASVDAEPQQGTLCGAYLALQFDDSLRVMTRELSPCGSTAPAEAFCLCPDGTVWCISDGTAARYIP